MSLIRSDLLNLKAKRIAAVVALGLTTSISSVYAGDGGCSFTTSEFMQHMFIGADGSFSMKNLKEAGDVTIENNNYKFKSSDVDFANKLQYLDDFFPQIQASFDQIRGKNRSFSNDLALARYGVTCGANKITFTVKPYKTAKVDIGQVDFNFDLTDAGAGAAQQDPAGAAQQDPAGAGMPPQGHQAQAPVVAGDDGRYEIRNGRKVRIGR